MPSPEFDVPMVPKTEPPPEASPVEAAPEITPAVPAERMEVEEEPVAAPLLPNEAWEGMAQKAEPVRMDITPPSGEVA